MRANLGASSLVDEIVKFTCVSIINRKLHHCEMVLNARPNSYHLIKPRPVADVFWGPLVQLENRGCSLLFLAGLNEAQVVRSSHHPNNQEADNQKKSSDYERDDV